LDNADNRFHTGGLSCCLAGIFEATALIEWAAFKELSIHFLLLAHSWWAPLLDPGFLYHLMTNANACRQCYWGMYLAFFFAAAYARDIQGMSYTESLNLLMIMSGVSILGRLVPKYFVDRISALTVFVPTAGLGALLIFCWIALGSRPGLYVWVAVSGTALGGIQSIFPSAVASLTADPSKQGTRIGMIFTIVSFAVLTGSPIAGTLIPTMQGRYVGAQIFAGTCLTVGTGFLIVSREVKRKKLNGAIWVKV
jgi:predicted MFS family arabinose efflux permease